MEQGGFASANPPSELPAVLSQASVAPTVRPAASGEGGCWFFLKCVVWKPVGRVSHRRNPPLFRLQAADYADAKSIAILGLCEQSV
jgi:hypothetical protein